MTPSSIHFAAPLWLLAGLLATVSLVLLQIRLALKRREALATFSSRGTDAASSISPWVRHLKEILGVAGIALVCVALARPQYGFREEETFRRGLDLMFVIDTSKSMLTPDLKPSRLMRAKLALYDLVSKFEGDRVGLVAFAGDAFLQCPLTLDRGMFEQMLDAVDTHIIPKGGTDVGRALHVAVDALQSQPANRKLVVLLTDGEDLADGALAAAHYAASVGVRVFTIGVGTASGDSIPLEGGEFMKDASGAFVHSRLDETVLNQIATITGGQYRALGPDGKGLEQLYQDVLEKLPQEALGERMHRIPLERFEWPLGLAAICLACDALLRERRRSRSKAVQAGSRARPFRGHARAAGVAMATALAISSQAGASVPQAESDWVRLSS